VCVFFLKHFCCCRNQSLTNAISGTHSIEMNVHAFLYLSKNSIYIFMATLRKKRVLFNSSKLVE